MEKVSFVFTEEDLRGCAEGKCCQCGLCCFVYRTAVPQQHGESLAPLIEKKEGEMCRHLRTSAHERFFCLLHGKGKPPACENWRGNDEYYGTGYSHYERTLRKAAAWITLPSDPSEIPNIQLLLRVGSFSEEVRRLARKLATQFPEVIIQKYIVDFRCLPGDIFDFLDLRIILRGIRDIEREEIVAMLDWSNPLHRSFMEEYMELRSPDVDAAGSALQVHKEER